MENKDIWIILRNIKIEDSSERVCNNQGVISASSSFSVLSAVRQVEDKLGLVSTDEVFENMTSDGLLETAGEMYLYLISCYPLVDTLTAFFKNFFRIQPPDVILMTLNRIIKSQGNSEIKYISILSSTAEKLFSKISTQFSLQYQHIKNMTLGISASPGKYMQQILLKGELNYFFLVFDNTNNNQIILPIIQFTF